MAAAAAVAMVATAPASGGGENSGRAGSAVTVVVLDAGATRGGADESETESSGDSTESADSSSSRGAGGPGDSGSHHPRLLAVPVTPAERAARAVGLDGVILRGWHIRALRRYAGLSVAELATRLTYSRGAIWDWECERHRCPSAVYAALIAACEAARAEREALFRRARLHLIVIDEAGAEEEGEA